MSFRKRLTIIILNGITAISAIVGIILCCTSVGGFMTGPRVFLFFTIQSNSWIGILCLVDLILKLFNKKTNRLYLIFKEVFTVAITLTGAVYVFVLAPTFFATAWELSLVLTHVVVPFGAIVSYFLDRDRKLFKKCDFLYAAIPPLYYLIFVIIGWFVPFDYTGSGVNFPYFFMNFGSPVGIFGFDFTSGNEYFMGSFYWIIVLLFFVLGISLLYLRVGKKKEN